MDRLIYIHIPKTGGSTMRQVMTVNVGKKHLFAVGSRHKVQIPWFFNLPQEERDKFQYVLGHICYGVHRLFSSGTAQYFTILRHPIERTLSAYSFALETETLPHHDEVKSMTFAEYLRSREPGVVQAKWLLGYVEGEPEPTLYGTPEHPFPDNAVDILKKRLEDEFVVTGLVERYDETLLLLQDALHWKNVYYFRSNVTSKRLRYKDLSDADKRTLDAMTGADFEIYDWAKARLAAQIDALGEPFQRRLEKFRRINPTVGERRRFFRRTERRIRRWLHIPKRPRNQ